MLFIFRLILFTIIFQVLVKIMFAYAIKIELYCVFLL